ncbi:glycosyltransferase family 2 protein [Streptomyces sp. NPDC127038]|uniref:glycosyltransferase family 2 protein n=1 Tax=Streptomyces sp. NPDC127038 TaxID=3347114 RepID=UPI00364E98B8
MNSALSAERTVPTLAVVICAYTLDRWDDIRAAIGSVLAQDPPADEVLLVVDHNRELLERAERELAGVHVVANARRRGLSGGRNTGVAVSHADVVAFLDDDATAEPGWTDRLLAPYRDPRVVGVGGFVRPWWLTGRPVWFPPEFDWVVGCSYRGQPRHSARVRNFIGANMSFRRSELIAVGGFFDAFGRVGSRPVASCDETDLCLRLAARDPRAVLLYEPAAEIRHRVPESRTSWAYFRNRCYIEGVSKALVARRCGRGPALANERVYVRSTISRALARKVTGIRQPGALRTIGALTGGVCATVSGYLVGSVRPLGSPAPSRVRQGGAEPAAAARS